MIYIYDGPPRSGKSNICVKKCRARWKRGENGYSNIPLYLNGDGKLTTDGINYFSSPYELIGAHNCWILIDEDQFVDNRSWQDLPKVFYDMLAQQGHYMIDLYITCLSRHNIDIKIDRSWPAYYSVNYLRWFRIPWNIRKYPWFQICILDFFPFFKIISKLWSKKYYDSYARVGMDFSNCETKISEKSVETKIF